VPKGDVTERKMSVFFGDVEVEEGKVFNYFYRGGGDRGGLGLM